MPLEPGKSYQSTIEDMDIGMEHIPGSVPADTALAEQSRMKAWDALIAASPGTCVGDQKIHVYLDNSKTCLCKTRKEPK